MQSRICTTFALLIILIVAVGGNAQKQDVSLIKKEVKITGRFKAGIWEAVHTLAALGIPIGFEGREGWNIYNEPKFVMESGKLEDILDSICNQSDYYTWTVDDGVVNIFPVSFRDKKLMAVLSTQVGPITVYKGESRAEVVDKLRTQFSKKSEDVEFYSVIERGNSLGLPDKYDEEIAIPVAELRTMLNKLAKPMKFIPMWKATTDPKTKMITISL